MCLKTHFPFLFHYTKNVICSCLCVCVFDSWLIVIVQLKSDLERRGGMGGGESFFDQISDAMDRILGFLIIEDKVKTQTKPVLGFLKLY